MEILERIPKNMFYRVMKRDPLLFGREMFPRMFDVDFAQFHRYMVNIMIDPPNTTIVLLIARHMGKSVISTFLVPIYLGVFLKYKYIVIGSQAGPKANEFVDDIKRGVTSDRFKAFFGNVKGEKWSATEVHLYSPEWKIDLRIKSKGQGMQFQGLRTYETRPERVILDDTEDPARQDDDPTIEGYLDMLDKVVIPGLDRRRGNVIIIGTTYKPDSMITRVADRPAGVTTIRLPAQVETDEQAEIAGVPIGKSIWEQAFPTALLESKKEEAILNGTLEAYLSQYQLSPKVRGFSGFNETDFINFDPAEESIMGWNAWLLTDAAYKKKKMNDPTGMILIAMDSRSHYYILEADEGRWDDKEFLQHMLFIVEKYHKALNIIIGIESYAYSFIRSAVYETLNNKNRLVPIVELHPKNRSKEDRIKALILPSQQKEMHIDKRRAGKFLVQANKFHGRAKQRGINILDAAAYILDVGYPSLPKDHEIQANKEARTREFEEFMEGLVKADVSRGVVMVPYMEERWF